MNQFIDLFRQDMNIFYEKTKAFYNGEITKAEYKGISGGFGSYAERDGKANMLRLRLPGGRISKDTLAFILQQVEDHQLDTIKLTTCETIQLHHLEPDTLFDIASKALDFGIICRGGGGDFPRNVIVSPLTGVQKDEYFDVMPYALAASDYLLSFIHGPKLPRKLKVAFSNSPENVPHATFRDLGFTANKDGSFDVCCAGGLGNNPKFGVRVAEQIAGEDILYYIHAMVDLFIEHGNYQNRGRARSRYLQDTLGKEGLIQAFQEKLSIAKQDPSLKLSVSPIPVNKTGNGTISNDRVIAQKQEGLFAVSYQPIGGLISPQTLKAISDIIQDMEDVELRISPFEEIYIINLTADEAQKVLDVTKDGAATPLEHSVACIGASICQQGVRDSQSLLRECIAAANASNLPANAFPQIHISGCPSSCGTHQTGLIGFHGGVKLIDKVPHPAFTLHVNGCDKQGLERMGTQLGVILQSKIPAFLLDLAQAAADADMDFVSWFNSHEDEFHTIAEKYLV